jgi:predicted nucleotidyltransferase
MTTATPLEALAELATHLRRLRVPFALVGGLAASIRGEVRFTRDVDVAIALPGDREVEALVRDLRAARYVIQTLIEHATRGRIATVRMTSPGGVLVDLLSASSGIEAEVVAHATPVGVEPAGELLVAAPEELLALKVLAMSDRRLQDRIDARNILLANPETDLVRVRKRLAQIRERGYDRGEPLEEKLEAVIEDVRRA